jgi:hemophore-related protein
MNLFETSARRRVVVVAAASALAALAVGVAPPSANAAPCAASGLATTASGVLAEAGGYLDAHPGANDVLTAAANQPPDEARSNVRGYFTGHPGEFLDLQRITQPLKDLRSQCGIAISPSQLASLFEALS